MHMQNLYFSKGGFSREFFQPTIDYLKDTQEADGGIPWFTGSHADPWDHVEAAMGLSIGGEYEAAENAYKWLSERQLTDGSWWAAYKNGERDSNRRRESNFVAYVATGVWHHYLITEDKAFLERMWTMVEKAIGFVIDLQTEHGDILWAVDENDHREEDALRTGCSSIYKSLECAANIATVLGFNAMAWLQAREQLGECLLHKPERFDRTWESKARYSMDWFYPVLTGVIPQEDAKAHLHARWDEFVEKGLGCRCVSDEPWVTIAESCELTMALLAAGEKSKAQELFSWLHQWRLDDGSYWTGYQFIMDLLWPDEKPTWTSGAILLAADALTHHTAASQLFTSVNILEPLQDAQCVNSI